jgi:hypothetical protein
MEFQWKAGKARMKTLIEEKKNLHFFFHISLWKNLPICQIAATPLIGVMLHIEQKIISRFTQKNCVILNTRPFNRFKILLRMRIVIFRNIALVTVQIVRQIFTYETVKPVGTVADVWLVHVLDRTQFAIISLVQNQNLTEIVWWMQIKTVDPPLEIVGRHFLPVQGLITIAAHLIVRDISYKLTF